MKTSTKPFVLIVSALVMTVLITGCEEALTDSNDKLVPAIEGEGTPFVEFVSAENPTASAGGAVELTVEPGEAIGEPIQVEFTASGPALGQVSPPGSATIPYDTSTTALDDATITVTIATGASPGETVTVELTSASTESGQTVQVGRGGTEVDRSRTITVE